ncbi:DUF1376 domain-containing protein [Bosea caraganae]|uniref:DUF1376 domain-containing protein n=1 Tax=Bosea caraganae TaxID=2763117 RepID=A0A370KYT9_9HYPH|nr:DUF1376 domain-containing protein [Bosea caraganae]RDJ20145.1 DUF1376 domain-containing protein [Bosea caraganae]RDJ24857.1 DUF1376 domain-containing protein [Bosea caraganae]
MSAPSPLPNRRPWMAFYVADYLADTLHLSAAQHGAYLLLISHYWVHGGLPNDEAMLQRIARLTPEEWTASRDTLASFFKDGWHHSRVEREMAEAREKYEKRANAGRCGGKASGNSRRSNASAMLPEKRSNAEPTTTTYSVPKGTGETAPELPSAEIGPLDWRTQLFRDGVSILTGLTGKPTGAARPLIGKWLKSSRDDCRRVLRVLVDARDANPIDPVAWIEAALRGQQAVASHDPNSWRM